MRPFSSPSLVAIALVGTSLALGPVVVVGCSSGPNLSGSTRGTLDGHPLTLPVTGYSLGSRSDEEVVPDGTPPGSDAGSPGADASPEAGAARGHAPTETGREFFAEYSDKEGNERWTQSVRLYAPMTLGSHACATNSSPARVEFIEVRRRGTACELLAYSPADDSLDACTVTLETIAGGRSATDRTPATPVSISGRYRALLRFNAALRDLRIRDQSPNERCAPGTADDGRTLEGTFDLTIPPSR